MRENLIKKIEELNLQVHSTPHHTIIFLYKYNKLLKKLDNKLIIMQIFNNLINLFFRGNTLVKNHILKLLTKRKKIFQFVDPLIFKTEILTNLLSLDADTQYCTIQLIIVFSDRMLNDHEILCELLFIENKDFNKNIILNKCDPQIKQLFYHHGYNIKKYDYNPKSEYKLAKNDLELMINYVKKYKNKYTVKLLIKHPVLAKYVKSFEVKEKRFLTLKEAKKLYRHFGLFIPEWNRYKFDLIKYDEQISAEYDKLFIFLLKYLHLGLNDRVRSILLILKGIEDLRVDYKIMFEYFYNKLNSLQCNEILINLYGLKANKVFKKLNKYIC